MPGLPVLLKRSDGDFAGRGREGGLGVISALGPGSGRQLVNSWSCRATLLYIHVFFLLLR